MPMDYLEEGFLKLNVGLARLIGELPSWMRSNPDELFIGQPHDYTINKVPVDDVVNPSSLRIEAHDFVSVKNGSERLTVEKPGFGLFYPNTYHFSVDDDDFKKLFSNGDRFHLSLMPDFEAATNQETRKCMEVPALNMSVTPSLSAGQLTVSFTLAENEFTAHAREQKLAEDDQSSRYRNNQVMCYSFAMQNRTP